MPTTTPAGTEEGRELPPVRGVRHRFVEANGITLHVAEAGPPDGDDVLVMLHGWPQHWYCFRELIPRLAPDVRVVCPDMRGFGWSDAPRRGYDKETLADDVVGVLDALDVESAHLLGHDWGGIVAWLVAAAHPERVRTLAALNTGHLWPAGGGFRNAWRILPYQSMISMPVTGAAFVRRAMVPIVAAAMRRSGTWTEVASRSFVEQFDDPARVAASVALYRTFLTREAPRWSTGRYRDLRVLAPTLVVHGTSDPVLRPAMLDGLEAHVPNLHIELVDGVNHFIAEEAPETVARLVAAHLAANP
ncbi:MAG: epoxide hydrolase [Thermoleophilia bacterium]|nr:epoxide hydrolase [Thermoleophilia bacterium]